MAIQYDEAVSDINSAEVVWRAISGTQARGLGWSTMRKSEGAISTPRRGITFLKNPRTATKYEKPRHKFIPRLRVERVSCNGLLGQSHELQGRFNRNQNERLWQDNDQNLGQALSLDETEKKAARTRSKNKTEKTWTATATRDR
ncbi:hypothetical protein B0H11DRAFT_1900129 [Mycena galericulata]|nr:hypothetical protein B0H11DRAFT_1900129 [Mycena galericulata]